MTLLSTKVAELIDELIASGQPTLLWRGILSTQEWKIFLSINERNVISAKIKRRDAGDGEPE